VIGNKQEASFFRQVLLSPYVHGNIEFQESTFDEFQSPFMPMPLQESVNEILVEDPFKVTVYKSRDHPGYPGIFATKDLPDVNSGDRCRFQRISHLDLIFPNQAFMRAMQSTKKWLKKAGAGTGRTAVNSQVPDKQADRIRS
jgi:hypothetical protein